ncbi:transmembrane protein, putative (macronuclear) [Tetrahymena thermophila SB210]|uniref:Transmembrane protein, putative n=1 Tax=Tetrahymena thermophila (strain SB210) TaxID=312017 RepID=Q22DB0_TETTS|nr:transmembrane protein, putative [Tetrahymena thermophila SB210]EAR83292.2 transmembrane protein, putative [Tetrahymena thermophila SB210]|eukprot:XP_001030955.2 transmembrane protein, putative [Tetrahymena thermophila SB210]
MIVFAVFIPHFVGNFLGERKFPNFVFISLILMWIFCIDLICPITNIIIKVVSFEFFAFITMPIMILNLSNLKSHDYRPFAFVYSVSYIIGFLIYFAADYQFRLAFQFILYQYVTVISYLRYIFSNNMQICQVKLNTINSNKSKTDKLLYIGKIQGRHLVMAKKANLMIFDMLSGQKLFQTPPQCLQRKKQILHLFNDDQRQILIYIKQDDNNKYKLYTLALRGFKQIGCQLINDDLSQKHVVYDSHSMSILYLCESYSEETNIQTFCLRKFSIMDSSQITSCYLNIGKLQIHNFTQFIFYNFNKLVVKTNYIQYADKLQLFQVDFDQNVNKKIQVQSTRNIKDQNTLNDELNEDYISDSEEIFMNFKKYQQQQQKNSTFNNNYFEFICDEIQEFFYYKKSLLVSTNLNIYLLNSNNLELKFKLDIFHLFATAYPLTQDYFIINKNDDYYICEIQENSTQNNKNLLKKLFWKNNQYKLSIKSFFKIPGGQNLLHISKIQNSKHIMLATKKLIINIIDFDPK